MVVEGGQNILKMLGRLDMVKRKTNYIAKTFLSENINKQQSIFLDYKMSKFSKDTICSIGSSLYESPII